MLPANATKEAFLQGDPSKWSLQSSAYKMADNKMNDITVEINPATATSAVSNMIYSCNASNLQAAAIMETPFGDNSYMTFRFAPMDQRAAYNYCPNVQYSRDSGNPNVGNSADGTLKNCMIGFFEADTGMFTGADIKTRPRWVRDPIQMKSYSFRVLDNVQTYAGSAVRGDIVKGSRGTLTGKPAFDPSMVFTILYKGGKVSYFVNDLLVDQANYSLPGGKSLFAYYAPNGLPSGAQMILNFSAGSLVQGGGAPPPCTTYCDPTPIYQASAAQASSALQQQASSALQQQASSALKQQASAALQQQASAAMQKQASSALQQQASAAYELKMRYFDASKILAKTLSASIDKGQALSKPVIDPLQPMAQGALSAIRAPPQGGGRRRRGKKTRRAKKSRRRH